jgi:tetratricopeptide (TPR) repeat protein
MALVYRKQGKWGKSQDLMRKVIKLNPQEALYLTNIGLSYAYLHDFDSALIFHQKAIDIMPIWSAPYDHKIHSLILKNGTTSESATALNEAINKTGDDLTELRIMQEIYQRNYNQALSYAKKSNSSDYLFYGTRYLYIGQIYNYLGNPTKARMYLDSAKVSFENDLTIQFSNPFLHCYLGITYAALGNREKAVAEGEKAIDLTENNKLNQSEVIINMSQIYTLTGDYDKAISTMEYLLINPSLFTIKLSLLDPVWDPVKELQGYKLLKAKFLVNRILKLS